MFTVLALEKEPHKRRGWKETNWRSKGDQKWFWRRNKKDLEKNDDENINEINEALKEIGAVCD